MFCSKCGKELPEGSKFCLSCGSPVEVKSYGESAAAADDKFGGTLDYKYYINQPNEQTDRCPDPQLDENGRPPGAYVDPASGQPDYYGDSQNGFNDAYYDGYRESSGKGKKIAIIACIAAAVVGIATTLIIVLCCSCSSSSNKVKGKWKSVNIQGITLDVTDNAINISDPNMIISALVQQSGRTDVPNSTSWKFDYSIGSNNEMNMTFNGRNQTLTYAEADENALSSATVGSMPPIDSDKWYVSDKYFVWAGIIFTRE